MSIETTYRSLLSQQDRRREDEEKRTLQAAGIKLVGGAVLNAAQQRLEERNDEYLSSMPIMADRAKIQAGERSRLFAEKVRDEAENYMGGLDNYLLDNYAIPEAQNIFYANTNEETLDKDSLTAEIRAYGTAMLEDKEVKGQTIKGLRSRYNDMVSGLDQVQQGDLQAYEAGISKNLPQNVAQGVFRKFFGADDVEIAREKTRKLLAGKYVDNANALVAAKTAFTMGLSNTDAQKLAEQVARISVKPSVVTQGDMKTIEMNIGGTTQKVPYREITTTSADGTVKKEAKFTQPTIQVRTTEKRFNPAMGEDTESTIVRTFVLNKDGTDYLESGTNDILLQGSRANLSGDPATLTEGQEAFIRAARPMLSPDAVKGLGKLTSYMKANDQADSPEEDLKEIQDRAIARKALDLQDIVGTDVLSGDQLHVIAASSMGYQANSGVGESSIPFFEGDYVESNQYGMSTPLNSRVSLMATVQALANEGTFNELTPTAQDTIVTTLLGKTIRDPEIVYQGEKTTMRGDVPALYVEFARTHKQDAREYFLQDPNVVKFINDLRGYGISIEELKVFNKGLNPYTLEMAQEPRPSLVEPEAPAVSQKPLSAFEQKKVQLLGQASEAAKTRNIGGIQKVQQQINLIDRYLELTKEVEGTEESIALARIERRGAKTRREQQTASTMLAKELELASLRNQLEELF